jgi:glutamyl-tRNA reductase
MRYSTETYEDWAEKVRLFELGYALQRIANGEPADLVLETMSIRITDKMLHPLHRAIKESVVPMTDAELAEHRKQYEEAYLNHNTPKHDQIEGQLFDKPE